MRFFRFQQPPNGGEGQGDKGQGDEGLGPPPDIFQFRRPTWRPPSGLLRWLLPLGVLLVLFIIANIAKGIYADVLWFDSVVNAAGGDFLSVFRLRIITRILP
ncbi:MAG: hypothetical protein IIC26_07555, partial [Chloroflexi bacterium]|nr:hypothetical protein [Chloroflexota bacterium]